jgi:hypothetical protein
MLKPILPSADVRLNAAIAGDLLYKRRERKRVIRSDDLTKQKERCIWGQMAMCQCCDLAELRH